jgi:hypothetical protein
MRTERRHTRRYAKLGRTDLSARRVHMSNEQQKQQDEDKALAGNQQTASQSGASQQQAQPDNHPDFDALAKKKPEELTPEELRLMADTMPGEGPGD